MAKVFFSQSVPSMEKVFEINRFGADMRCDDESSPELASIAAAERETGGIKPSTIRPSMACETTSRHPDCAFGEISGLTGGMITATLVAVDR